MNESKEAMTMVEQTSNRSSLTSRAVHPSTDRSGKQSRGSMFHPSLDHTFDQAIKSSSTKHSPTQSINQSIDQSNNQSSKQILNPSDNPGLSQYVFESVEVDIDDDPSIIFEALPIIEDDPVNQSQTLSADPMEEENLRIDSFLHTVRTLRATNPSNNESTVKLPSIKQSNKQSNNATIDPTFQFMQSLLSRASMTQTLSVFRNEWRDCVDQMNNIANNQSIIEPLSIEPDIHLNAEYKAEINRLQSLLQSANATINQLNEEKKSLMLEKNFHKIHHRRALAEKKNILQKLKKYDSHLKLTEPLIENLKRENEKKEKKEILAKIEKDKLLQKIQRLEEMHQSGERTQSVDQADKQSINQRKSNKQPTNQSKNKKNSPKNDQSTNQPNEQSNGQSSKPTGHLIGDRHEALPNSWPLQSTANPFQSMNPQSNNQPINEINCLRGTYACHPVSVTNLSFHPTKNLLATCSDDRTWKLWSSPSNNAWDSSEAAVSSVSAPKLILTGQGHTNYLTVAKFHPGGGFMLSSGGDATVRLWCLNPPALKACFRTFGHASGLSANSQEGLSDFVWDLDWHYGGDYFVVGHQNSLITVHDIHTEKNMCTFRGHGDCVNAAQFLPFTGDILSASGDATVALWDSRHQHASAVFRGHSSTVLGLSVSNDARTFLSSCGDGVIKEWDLRTQQVLASTQLDHAVYDVAYSPLLSLDPSNRRFASACEDGVVRIHQSSLAQSNDEGLAVLRDLTGHDGAVNCVMWDPNGKLLYSGGADGSLRVWA